METVPWGLALLTSLEMSKGLTIIVLHEVLQIGGERFLKQRVFRSVARRPMKSSPVLLWMPEVMSGAEQGLPVPVASWSLRLKLGVLILCNSRCVEEAGPLDPLRGYVGSGTALSTSQGGQKVCLLHVCAHVFMCVV